VARNRKIGAISLSAALAVAVALFVLGWIRRDRSAPGDEPGGRADRRNPVGMGIYLFDLETRQPTRVADIVSLKPTIAVSPDGTTVAYQAMGAAGQEVIYLANVDGTHVRALKETAATGEPIGPRFSPDGSQIVFQAKGSGPRVGNLPHRCRNGTDDAAHPPQAARIRRQDEPPVVVGGPIRTSEGL
jgi:hypothetical protein